MSSEEVSEISGLSQKEQLVREETRQQKALERRMQRAGKLGEKDPNRPAPTPAPVLASNDDDEDYTQDELNAQVAALLASAPPLKVPKKKSSPSPQQACPGCGTVLENRFCGECGLDSQKPEDGGNKEKEVETPEQKEARELREKAIAFRLRKNLQKMNKKK